MKDTRPKPFSAIDLKEMFAHPPDIPGVAAIAPYAPFSQDLNRFTLKVANLGAPSANVTWGNQTKMFTRHSGSYRAASCWRACF